MFIEDNPKTEYIQEDQYAVGILMSVATMTLLPVILMSLTLGFEMWVVYAKTYVLTALLFSMTEYAIGLLLMYILLPLFIGMYLGKVQKYNSSYYLGYFSWLFLWYIASAVYVVVR